LNVSTAIATNNSPIHKLILSLFFYAQYSLKKSLPSAPAIYTFAAIILFHSIFINAIADAHKPLFGFILAVGALVFLAKKYSSKNIENLTKWQGPIFVVFLTVLYGAFLTLFPNKSIEQLAFYNLAYGMLFVVGSRIVGRHSPSQQVGLASLALGHLQVLIGGYRLAQDASNISMMIGLLWGLYALLILGGGYQLKDRVLAKSALVIFTAVTLKVLFYDLWSSGNLFRVFSLLIAGLALYLAGWIYKRIESWPILPRQPQV